jgi:hypothetical protein
MIMTHDYDRAGEFIVKMMRNIGDKRTKIIYSDGITIAEGYIDAEIT